MPIVRAGWPIMLELTAEADLEAINHYHKVLHLGCCSSPGSTSGQIAKFLNDLIQMISFPTYIPAWGSHKTAPLNLFFFWCKYLFCRGFPFFEKFWSCCCLSFIDFPSTSCYLKLLDKLQKLICRTVGPSLVASLERLAHGRNVATLSLFYRYHFGRFSLELAQLVLPPYSQGRSTR